MIIKMISYSFTDRIECVLILILILVYSPDLLPLLCKKNDIVVILESCRNLSLYAYLGNGGSPESISNLRSLNLKMTFKKKNFQMVEKGDCDVCC
jgi:hypothetical protein